MDCTQCEHKLPSDARFCTECGSFQGDSASCLQCWHRLPEGAKFCSECGSSQDVTAAKSKSIGLRHGTLEEERVDDFGHQRVEHRRG